MVSLYKSLNRYFIGIQVVLTKKNDKKTAIRILIILTIARRRDNNPKP